MMELKMITIQILAFITLAQAAYYSRMSVNRRVPTAFRPGVAMPRPWNHRLMPAASHRTPYVVYRPTHRYAMKPFGPTRNMFSGQWQTTARLPSLAPVTPQYEFVRAASAPPLVHKDGGSGAIHTIPAPNLSLSEKPIVVVEDTGLSHRAVTENPKTAYEVTEKYLEPFYQMAKIETPVGFAKPQTIQATPELQTLVRNGAALQVASEYGLSAISVPQNPAPQQFAVHGLQPFNGIPPQQENSGADNIMIPANVLYQSDPMFLQKLQQQLLHRFPAVEFVPYAAELMPQNPQPQHNPHSQPAPQFFLLENEQIKQPQETFVPSESKNVVQRETQENSLVTLIPQTIMVNNVTEKPAATETTTAQNITLELVAAETQPVTTTIKYVTESNTEAQKTEDTPIYYAQIGQSVGSAIANGFYSAMNDARAAAALEQVESKETTKAPEPTTTKNPDLQQYFVQNSEKNDNKTVTELKPHLGVPFAKPADSVNVAYTLMRAEEKEPKINKEGAVYAGQIVEASISEDTDFNNQKATLMKRAPIRLFAVTEKKENSGVPNITPKVTVVKAKIPPKSKLTFDDKTGEPVLRIYASYVDNPTQKDLITQKLTSLKPVAMTHKEAIENWKTTTIRSADKTQGFDGNQLTKFGLKLRSRSDDYVPLFEDYDD